MPATTAATTDGAMTAAAGVIVARAATLAVAEDLVADNVGVPAGLADLADPVVAVLDAVRVGEVPSVADATGAETAVLVRAPRAPGSLPARL